MEITNADHKSHNTKAARWIGPLIDKIQIGLWTHRKNHRRLNNQLNCCVPHDKWDQLPGHMENLSEDTPYRLVQEMSLNRISVRANFDKLPDCLPPKTPTAALEISRTYNPAHGRGYRCFLALVLGERKKWGEKTRARGRMSWGGGGNKKTSHLPSSVTRIFLSAHQRAADCSLHVRVPQEHMGHCFSMKHPLQDEVLTAEMGKLKQGTPGSCWCQCAPLC